ncbi:MAG: EAL domain-containing protein [Gallionella sp.]|nr:EAL domain-containing protein [Gallionella sp.]
MSITSAIGRLALCLFLGLLAAAWQTAQASVQDRHIRIGVTSFRTTEQTLKQWQPTADYLSRAIPHYRFSIVPLYLDDLASAVREGKVEFVLTNPEQYVVLRSDYSLAALATLMNASGGRPVSQFGGVIFTRAERSDIEALGDLEGKTLAAVHDRSFAAYLVQRWTLFTHGIDIAGSSGLRFVGLPQDKVVSEVLSGKADAGFVRTGVLEAMVAENKLSPSEFKVLNRQQSGIFPQLLSTELYPEWPLSSMRNVPDELIKAVAQALFDLKPEDAAARSGKYYGFMPPGDYSSVEAVMLKLRALPNRNADFNWRDIYQKYFLAVSAGLIVLFLGILAGAIYLWRNNRYLRRVNAERDKLALSLSVANATLEARVDQRTRQFRDSQASLQLMLNSMSEGMYGVDLNGNCTFVNAAFLRILGYADEDEIIGESIHKLIHHTRADGSPYPESDCRMYKAFRENQATHADDEVFWRKDGSSIAVAYWAHPVINDGAVVGAVATFVDVTERKLAEQQIQQLAFYDPLTSLPNRRLLMERLRQACALSDRDAQYGAVLFMDMDHFKILNDTKGHDFGDQLLIEVGRRLESCLREGDTVARLGGDEFVVVLECLSVNSSEAAQLAERVAEKIHDELNRPYQLKDYLHSSTPSIGIVLYKGHSDSIDDLLKFADIAMYQAKTAGRNAIRFYDPDMQTEIEQRATLEAELRQAIELEQFRLYYQIQVDRRSRPIGAEVLLRWEHPERGLVSPLHFIPMAEETGLILPIGEWVLMTACEQLKKWQAGARTRDLALAVNVSALQFGQSGFVDQVREMLSATGADGGKLKLEMTESMMLDNVEDIICKMNQLKQLGVSFSLDDFGTGYSSLQYLKRLPLDQIKIDQSFVRDIATDSNDEVIVNTIIAMTDALGLNIIAEGVENQVQHAFLEQCGCNAFQGYLFSRPVPLEQFEALLDSWQVDVPAGDEFHGAEAAGAI